MKNKTLIFIINSPIYWVLSGLLIIDGGDKKLVALIIISLIARIILTILNKKLPTLNLNIFNKSLLIISFYAILSYYTNGYSSSEIRVITSLTIYFTLINNKFNISEDYISHYCLLLSSLIILLMIINWGYLEDLGRGAWGVNAIPLANYTSILLITAVTILSKVDIKINPIILIVSIVILFICIIMSDTRGAWLALLLTIFTLFSLGKLSFPKLRIVSTLTTIAIATLIFLNTNIISERIISTQNEIEKISEGNLYSSIGLRLQLWQVGYTIIKEEKPIFGSGQTAHLEKIEEMYSKGEISKSLYRFDNKNFHNEFIDRIIKYGLIGFLCILLVLFTAILDSKNKIYKNGVIGIVIYTVVAGMTYLSLGSAIVFAAYITSVSVLNYNRKDAV
ncbi:O-antigen ligase family protein [Vibrio breoganii]